MRPHSWDDSYTCSALYWNTGNIVYRRKERGEATFNVRQSQTPSVPGENRNNDLYTWRLAHYHLSHQGTHLHLILDYQACFKISLPYNQKNHIQIDSREVEKSIEWVSALKNSLPYNQKNQTVWVSALPAKLSKHPIAFNTRLPRMF